MKGHAATVGHEAIEALRHKESGTRTFVLELLTRLREMNVAFVTLPQLFCDHTARSRHDEANVTGAATGSALLNLNRPL